MSDKYTIEAFLGKKKRKPQGVQGGSYRLGYRRCGKCEYYIKTVANHCPCCGDILKRKPRNNKARQLYNEAMRDKV